MDFSFGVQLLVNLALKHACFQCSYQHWTASNVFPVTFPSRIVFFSSQSFNLSSRRALFPSRIVFFSSRSFNLSSQLWVFSSRLVFFHPKRSISHPTFSISHPLLIPNFHPGFSHFFPSRINFHPGFSHFFPSRLNFHPAIFSSRTLISHPVSHPGCRAMLQTPFLVY